jgi:phosphoserine aminotransferase
MMIDPSTQKVHNFSAGPAKLPEAVLTQAQAELRDFRGSGMSVMEISHRSALFDEVIKSAEARLRRLMAIPESYAVLFVQGGAWTQFSAVPLNLMQRGRADYIDTGSWSAKAIIEARRYGQVRVVASSKEDQYRHIPAWTQEDLDPSADYLHITTNNTIYGTTFPTLPDTGEVPLVADMSSDILSVPYRVEKFGVIYAGAQKNIGPAGLTIVIVRRDLLGHAHALCPQLLNYQTHADKGSLFNTPPTFAIYLADLVFAWLEDQGGLAAMAERNRAKAALLYQYLDQSSLFQPLIQSPHRSLMNVVFRLPRPEQEQYFIAASEAAGFRFLKGHRSVGGMRASLYNAVPPEAVGELIAFMREFEEKIGENG